MSASRRWSSIAVVVAALLLAGGGLFQATSDSRTMTPKQQVDAISATIRCPTCQGLSIKDSPSVLATGSRQIVEEQVAQGRSPDEIRQYFVDRYGEFILLSPARRGKGLLVWLLPLIALPAAGVFAWRHVRRARSPSPGPRAAPTEAGDTEADGDAAEALRAFRSGQLDPDDSAGGEALREALVVCTALAEDDVVDVEAVRRAELRLAAAARRYRARGVRTRDRTGSGRALPRRALTAVTVTVLLVAATAALAAGLRSRGVNDLPTGDLPSGTTAVPSQPGLKTLIASTAERPDDPEAWIALGRAYDGTDQLTQALAAYDRALRLRPGADDVTLLRAGILVRAGSATEALPALTDLAARYPDDPDTVLLLGLAQDKTGAPPATATLQRFLELAPDAPTAPAVRKMLAAR